MNTPLDPNPLRPTIRPPRFLAWGVVILLSLGMHLGLLAGMKYLPMNSWPPPSEAMQVDFIAEVVPPSTQPPVTLLTPKSEPEVTQPLMISPPTTVQPPATLPPSTQPLTTSPPSTLPASEPENSPPQWLNDLIEETDSDQLSMKLLKRTQTAPQTENPPPQPLPRQGQSTPPTTLLQPPASSEAKTAAALPVPPKVAAKAPLASKPPASLDKSLAKPQSITPERPLPVLPQPAQEKTPLPESPEASQVKNSDAQRELAAPEPEKPLEPKSELRQAPPEVAVTELSKASVLAPPLGFNLPRLPNPPIPPPPAPSPPGTPQGDPQAPGPNTNYTLSNYQWEYQSYLGRWGKGFMYNWNNNPPMDYATGRVPRGGDVFVLVTLNRQGQLVAYEVTQAPGASEEMVTSVLNAIAGVSRLPPLPEDFKDEVLKVHFRFFYPPISELMRR